MSYRTCSHLKGDGLICNSPALRGRKYCYFHLDAPGPRLNTAFARAWVQLRLAKARDAEVTEYPNATR